MSELLGLLILGVGVVGVSAGIGKTLVHTPPKTRAQTCEARVVPSSYLLGDQLLHKIELKRCLSRMH